MAESRYYESQRLKMHYLAWGDEAKPPLILIHGTRDHARSWDRVVGGLTDRYCVYTPDLRGHGDSAGAMGGDYSIIDYALDIHALGEAIGRAPYTVIGHDLEFDRQRGFTITEGGIVIVPKAEPPETFQAPNVLPN